MYLDKGIVILSKKELLYKWNNWSFPNKLEASSAYLFPATTDR